MGKRKVMQGGDVIAAAEALGFDNYIKPMRVYLEKYKEVCVSEAFVLDLDISSDTDQRYRSCSARIYS